MTQSVRLDQMRRHRAATDRLQFRGYIPYYFTLFLEHRDIMFLIKQSPRRIAVVK